MYRGYYFIEYGTYKSMLWNGDLNHADADLEVELGLNLKLNYLGRLLRYTPLLPVHEILAAAQFSSSKVKEADIIISLPLLSSSANHSYIPKCFNHLCPTLNEPEARTTTTNTKASTFIAYYFLRDEGSASACLRSLLIVG
jgi:hypothetical protein